MHDNFEKEVQRKMEEMQLTPSPPVWEKIEMEIGEQKKRRRGIFWFLLAGLLLTGGGWLGYQSLHKNKRQAAGEIKMPVSKSNPATTSVSTHTYKKAKNFTDGFDTTVAVEKTKQLTKKPQGNSTSTLTKKQKSFDTETADIIEPKNNSTATSEEQVVISTATENKKQDSQVKVVKPLETTTPVNETTASKKNTDSISSAKEQKPVATDSAVNPIISKEQLPLAAIDSSLKKKVAFGKKWKKQASLNIGRSSYASGLFSNADARLYFAIPLQSSTGGTGNFVNASPATISGGLAFAAGFHLTKELNKQWEFSVGLQYSYYSTQARVGDKRAMDTTANFGMDKLAVAEFYTNTGRNNYTSRFHVVEIPVSISYQPVQKAPLHISVGVSYGRLLSTNALTYNRASNFYYKNNKNYNRNYVPVTASVQYRFKSKKSVSIQTGPVIQYNLSKLQKEALVTTPHLFFAGLKTDIRF